MLVRRFAPRFTPLTALLVACALVTTPAIAQSDLEKENAELREKVAKLEKDLELAVERIKLLNNELAKLRKQSGQKGGRPGDKSGGTPTDGGATAGGPKSSPGAVLAALKESYQEKLGALPTDSRADQIRFQREAASWTGEAEKEHSGDAEWHIRLTELPNMTSRGTTIKFDLLDAPGGSVVEQGLELTVNTRLGRSMSLDQDQKEWTLTGPMRVQPRVNMRRPDELSSSPGDPPLIGPYVEFRYDFNVTDVKKPEPAQP